MTSTPPTETFQRSCQHWSEDGRLGMEAFYRLASYDYQLLAEELDWQQVFQDLSKQSGDRLSLLDVACGSGQFPAALLTNLQQKENLNVDYSLLDPSDFSIRTAREKLNGPFQPSEEYCCTIQQFNPPDDGYDVVWATHALYCVPPGELEVAVDQMLTSLKSKGLGCIAHASQQSHYVRFHDLYLQNHGSAESLPYSTGEQLVETLQSKIDDSSLHRWTIEYEGQLDLNDRDTAERYLQRCLFDDSLSLEEMLADEPMGNHLRSCIDEENGVWRFPQKVWLMFFGEFGRTIETYRRRQTS